MILIYEKLCLTILTEDYEYSVEETPKIKMSILSFQLINRYSNVLKKNILNIKKKIYINNSK